MTILLLSFILAIDTGLLVALLFWFLSGTRGHWTRVAQEQARDEVMLSSIADGVLATNREGRVTMFNKACSQMLGWQAKEVIGKKLVDVVSMLDDAGHEIPASQRPLAQTLERGKISSFVEHYRRKDGTIFPVSITVSPIVFQGSIDGAIAVVRDVSREKEIDRAKTEFVSLASHQLRTPISIINWYVEAMLSGDVQKFSSRQKNYLKQVHESGIRMAELVDALLNVSRLEMGTFAVNAQEMDLIEVVHSLVAELRPELKRHKHTLTLTLSKKRLPVLLDRRWVWIVLQNLLTNAIKYTPDEGKIDLEIDQKGERIHIRVTDSGVGIPEKQQGQIFSKLFRAENVQSLDVQGSGLGLYIVKSIVEKMGGTIRFTSRVGKGTTFYVTL